MKLWALPRSRTSSTISDSDAVPEVGRTASAASSPSHGRMSRAKLIGPWREPRRRSIVLRTARNAGSFPPSATARLTPSRSGSVETLRKTSALDGTSPAAAVDGGSSPPLASASTRASTTATTPTAARSATSRRRWWTSAGSRARARSRRSGARSTVSGIAGLSPIAPTLDEVDHQRHALEAVAIAQAVLDEVGIVAGQAVAGVDRDGKAWRPRSHLCGVEHLEPVAVSRRRLAGRLDLGQEAVELGRGDAHRSPVGERQRLGQQPPNRAAGLRAHGQHARAQAQLLGDLCPLVVEVDLRA